jgi:hypothetical protein
MRRFLTSAALVISLFGTAGFADARGFGGGGRQAGHGPVVRGGGVRGGEIRGGGVRGGGVRGGEIRGGGFRGGVVRGGGYGGYRDFGYRPAPYAEHYAFRAGYTWHAGDWQWNGYEWVWVQGYYVAL